MRSRLHVGPITAWVLAILGCAGVGCAGVGGGGRASTGSGGSLGSGGGISTGGSTATGGHLGTGGGSSPTGSGGSSLHQDAGSGSVDAACSQLNNGVYSEEIRQMIGIEPTDGKLNSIELRQLLKRRATELEQLPSKTNGQPTRVMRKPRFGTRTCM